VDRRAFISGITVGLLAAPLAAGAQRPDRIRRIGILLFTQQDLAVITPCLQELKALGYVDSETVAMEYRDAEGKCERLPGLAVELVRLSPDVIFSFGGEQAPIVKRATASIPIVVVVSNDPVARLQLQSLEVREASDFEGAFQAAIRERAEALIVAGSRLLHLHRQQIGDFVAKNRLILVGTPKWLSEIGSLLTYGPNPVELNRRAAGYVDKILKGAKPADLPMQQPATFELVINLKTAKALGLDCAHRELERWGRSFQPFWAESSWSVRSKAARCPRPTRKPSARHGRKETRSGRGSATGRDVGLWRVAALAAAAHDPLTEHGKASLARSSRSPG
jgi:ABC-type uncharacterized transport system substrate-binding protein